MTVQLLEVLGTDLTVVNAARVSMQKESYFDWEYVEGSSGIYKEVLNERDEKLIKYLADHNHWTPFAHPQLQFRIKMPIFVARQWYKHIVGLVRNEVSRRYVSDIPEFFYPTSWRERAASVKQGSGNDIVDDRDKYFFNLLGHVYDTSVTAYREMLKANCCPEQARMVLPQGMQTEFIETGSLAAYARICKLRLDPHAQYEVQLYAEMISDIVKQHFPVSWRYLINE